MSPLPHREGWPPPPCPDRGSVRDRAEKRLEKCGKLSGGDILGGFFIEAAAKISKGEGEGVKGRGLQRRSKEQKFSRLR